MVGLRHRGGGGDGDAVAEFHFAWVEDDAAAFVLPGSDEAADALAEFEDGFGERAIAKCGP